MRYVVQLMQSDTSCPHCSGLTRRMGGETDHFKCFDCGRHYLQVQPDVLVEEDEKHKEQTEYLANNEIILEDI